MWITVSMKSTYAPPKVMLSPRNRTRRAASTAGGNGVADVANRAGATTPRAKRSGRRRIG